MIWMHGDGVMGWLGGRLVYFLVVGDLNAQWGIEEAGDEEEGTGREISLPSSVSPQSK